MSVMIPSAACQLLHNAVSRPARRAIYRTRHMRLSVHVIVAGFTLAAFPSTGRYSSSGVTMR
jgi:hypothetical protein